MATKKPKSKRYWYKFYWGQCPVCGSDKSYKERIYEPKPLDVKKRHEILPDAVTYDSCLG